MTAAVLPKEFLWRRAHSLTGFFLTLYIIFHLLTNSQAALWIGDDGQGFIHSVNNIQSLPYLPVLEIGILALPILIHMWWGIVYARQAKFNSFKTDGSAPALGQYPRNRAYTWQRITAWLLVLGIIGHIIHMRFYEHPTSAKVGHETNYFIRLDNDPGLSTLSERLDFKILNPADVKSVASKQATLPTDPVELQKYQQEKQRIHAISEWPLQTNEVVAVTKDFGTAELLMVRNTFKSPIMMMLYTFFVLAATFHGFNGLWTFMISWGVTISEKTQRKMLIFSQTLMVIVTLLGLSAIWLTYWVNLKS